MVTSKVCVPVALAACCSLTSCVNAIAHDQKAAAKSADQFARTAFVSRDSAKAHGLLAPALAKRVPAEQLGEMIAKMHPKSFPSRVSAIEYEPMPGQRGMTIYLKGDGEAEEFHYRLVMEGDSPSGYRVTGLFRGSGPHPSTTKRPL